MASIEELRKLDQDLAHLLSMEKQKEGAEQDKTILVKLLGETFLEVVEPILQDTATTFNAQLEEQKNILGEGMLKMVEAVGKVQVNVSELKIPEIVIPKIESPKIPQISIPDVKVDISTKSIEKSLKEAFKGLKPPIVNVPKADIKVPKIEWPKDNMPISGDVGIKGIDLNNPLPVQLRTADGKPFKIETSSGGGRSGLSQKDSKALEDISGKDYATEATLAKLAGLSIPIHDYIALTYVAAGDGVGEIETVVFKTGGSGGATVATLTLTYNASDEISSITKT